MHTLLTGDGAAFMLVTLQTMQHSNCQSVRRERVPLLREPTFSTRRRWRPQASSRRSLPWPLQMEGFPRLKREGGSGSVRGRLQGNPGRLRRSGETRSGIVSV